MNCVCRSIAAWIILLVFIPLSYAQQPLAQTAVPQTPAPQTPAPQTAAPPTAAPPTPAQVQNPLLSKPQIEQMVAPFALYPDPLIVQLLMASTYPGEIANAANWMKANPHLKGKGLEESLQHQSWDESVKSLTAIPELLYILNDKIDMTRKLGDTFLAQKQDVLDAIQTLRARAQTADHLKSNRALNVSQASEGNASTIIIELANPDVLYVPMYDPNVIYGTWPDPKYPPNAFHPTWFTRNAGMFSFAPPVTVGNALWGHVNWTDHHVGIDVDRFNQFNHTQITDNTWHHNPDHRKAVVLVQKQTTQNTEISQDRLGQGSQEAQNTPNQEEAVETRRAVKSRQRARYYSDDYRARAYPYRADPRGYGPRGRYMGDQRGYRGNQRGYRGDPRFMDDPRDGRYRDDRRPRWR